MSVFAPRQPHAMSHHFAVTSGLISACQWDYLAGRDLFRTLDYLDADRVTLIAGASLL